MKKLKVDLDELERCMRYFKGINSVDLCDIEWVKGDTSITPTQEDLDEFSFIGFSNRDFPSYMGWVPDDVGIKFTSILLKRK
jgi:hypothetical protein